MAAPAMADAGCETCGSGVHSMGYDGYNTSSYGGGEVIGGGTYEGVVRNQPNYAGEVVSPRAQ